MSDRDYWERHARNYDRSMVLLGGPMKRTVELCAESVQGCDRVLEVAAGTGLVTSAIAGAAGEVVATDYAAAMVERLERRVREQGLANVRCEQADIYDLRYESGAFDAVVATNVLHLVPDLERALAALRRVLRPGGRLVTATYCHDQNIVSGALSRLLALTRFPGHRRFRMRSLRTALEASGLRVTSAELVPGLVPIGVVVGVYPT